MYLIKKFKCKCLKKHTMVTDKKGRLRCEICFKSQKTLDHPEIYEPILKKIKR